MTTPSAFILYVIIIIIVSALEGWFIHRRIENEWDRWQVFVIIVLVADIILAVLEVGSWAMLGLISGGLLLAMNINRLVQNLISQREKNQGIVARLGKEIEAQINRGTNQ